MSWCVILWMIYDDVDIIVGVFELDNMELMYSWVEGDEFVIIIECDLIGGLYVMVDDYVVNVMVVEIVIEVIWMYIDINYEWMICF